MILPRFEIQRTEPTEGDEGYFWRLRARNGEVLAHSENYTTLQAARKGVRAARTASLTATVKES